MSLATPPSLKETSVSSASNSYTLSPPIPSSSKPKTINNKKQQYNALNVGGVREVRPTNQLTSLISNEHARKRREERGVKKLDQKSQKHQVYFPYDKKTLWINFTKKDARDFIATRFWKRS